ncbi:MAG: hypothetical protein D6722_29510 [Bacteroidetes bacterium]|nr:MAG: hypothetical protein D6722_29510 [Bacteroidota bacterium]
MRGEKPEAIPQAGLRFAQEMRDRPGMGLREVAKPQTRNLPFPFLRPAVVEPVEMQASPAFSTLEPKTLNA